MSVCKCGVFDVLSALVGDIVECSELVGSGIRDWLVYVRRACGASGPAFEELVGNAISVLYDLDNLVEGLYGVRLPSALFEYTRLAGSPGDCGELVRALQWIARLVCGDL